MSRLPVISKTKLTKEQTYFVNAAELSDLLANTHQFDKVALRFSDDPSQRKSNYDRFVKQEGKLVILSVRYTPPGEENAGLFAERSYVVTVYAILRAIREDLIAQFNALHFQELVDWLNEKRDATWLQKPHAMQFLIDIDDEEIEVAYDIDFDSYSRHSKKQKFRAAGRKR